MTEISPKDRSIKLFDKFSSWQIINEHLGCGFHYRELYREDAIELAIDQVDELIRECAMYNSDRKSYWRSVKFELEKLR